MIQIPDAAVMAAKEWLENSDPIDVEGALAAAYPHLPLGFEVKQLEWEYRGQRHPPSEELYSAKTSFCTYMITVRVDGSYCSLFTVEWLGFGYKATSLEQAKAAAQADFERRVRECITLTNEGIKPPDEAAVRSQAFEELISASIAAYNAIQHYADVNETTSFVAIRLNAAIERVLSAALNAEAGND